MIEKVASKIIKMAAHLSSVACLLNGIHKQDKALPVVLNIRSKTTFISNIACILTIFRLNDALKNMVNCKMDE